MSITQTNVRESCSEKCLSLQAGFHNRSGGVRNHAELIKVQEQTAHRVQDEIDKG